MASSRTMWSCRARILLSAWDQGPAPLAPAVPANEHWWGPCNSASLQSVTHPSREELRLPAPTQPSLPALTFSLESCPSSFAALKIICVPCGEQRDRNGPSQRLGWGCHGQAGHAVPGACCSSGDSPGPPQASGGWRGAPRRAPGATGHARHGDAGVGLAAPSPAPEFSAQVCGLGTSGHEGPLASGTSDPAQHKQLGPRVPSCSLWCPSTHFCIQQSPARHIIGTAWKIICHWGGGSRG